MRITAVTLLVLAAGCFNPRITDGGFACDPADPVPCPEGFFCRDLGSGFVCTSALGAGMVPGAGGDLAGGGGADGGGAAEDAAMPPAGADLATAPGDLASPADMALPPPSNCGLAQLVINEVKTAGATASDEFVEIYNPCAAPLTVTGALVYRAATGDKDIKLCDIKGRTIGKTGYLVAGGSGYQGQTDATFNAGTGLSDTGGGVALVDGNGKVVNAMGWGNATNAYVQGSAAPAAHANQSMARKPNGANTHRDNADFQVVSTPTPRAAN